MPYKFEREELLRLLVRAYDEGNHGFLDLSEAVAERLLEESENKYEEPPEIMPLPPFYPHDDMPTINDILNNNDSHTFSISDTFRNTGYDPVIVDTIRIQAGDVLPDNLVLVNSNQWEPYEETHLIRKET